MKEEKEKNSNFSFRYLGENDSMTKNKVYKVIDGIFTLDDSRKTCIYHSYREVEVKFGKDNVELVDENYGNFDAICTKDGVSFKKGDIIKVRNSRFLFGDGSRSSGLYSNIDSLRLWISGEYELYKPEISELEKEIERLKRENEDLIDANEMKIQEHIDVEDKIREIFSDMGLTMYDQRNVITELEWIKETMLEFISESKSSFEDYSLLYKECSRQKEEIDNLKSSNDILSGANNNLVKSLDNQRTIISKAYDKLVDILEDNGVITLCSRSTIEHYVEEIEKILNEYKNDYKNISKLSNEDIFNILKERMCDYDSVSHIYPDTSLKLKNSFDNILYWFNSFERNKKDRKLKAIKYIQDKKIAIHCTTEEEENDFIDLFKESFNKRIARKGYARYLKNTCRSIEKTITMYCSKLWYMNNGYKIIKFEDLETLVR